MDGSINSNNNSSSGSNNLQLCRICISSNSHSNCSGNASSLPQQMISIFGEDSLWRKITTLADVKIEKGDTLPQQVCVACAKNAISACLFKKKCEDADNFFRQQLLIQKFEGKTRGESVPDVITLSEGDGEEEERDDELHQQQHHRQRQQLQRNESELDEDDEDEHGHANAHHHHLHVADDGEIIKSANGKQQPAPFDFNSIRLMHVYMQQQLSKINGGSGNSEGLPHGSAESDAAADDDEPLPLIPEIELITPSDDMNGNGGGNGDGIEVNVTPASGITVAPMRGYQCPSCFQIFEMKQILKAHMQSVHGTAGPVYECANCKKTYFYKRFLEKHVRRGRCVKKRRNQTRPMQCSDCHVLFPTGHHLGWHKRTGCPSRAAKMPLQQLFKQNIVQYNNFPKRIGIRKPENAIYLHNRKLIMANNKRKGRTRIKLDAKKIALAKQLILREATTTVIANELNISRTFAWRLRKSLVNGVSLHERVIDPNAGTEDQPSHPQMLEGDVSQRFQHAEAIIKAEKIDSDGEENSSSSPGDNVDEEHEHDEDMGEDEDEEDGGNDVHAEEQNLSMQQQSNEQIRTEQQKQQELLYGHALEMTIAPVRTSSLLPEQQEERDLDEGEGEENDDEEGDGDVGEVCSVDHRNMVETDHYVQNNIAQRADGSVIRVKRDLDYQKSASASILNGNLQTMPLLSQFPPAVAAAIHQLPVNLSIRPISSMQHSETTPPPLNHNNQNNHNNTSSSEANKKPRKPNVFIDDEKYAMAKMLVAQNSSTMEIARALNVSQMTAWKVRDAIVKGVPLSYRSKRDMRDVSSTATIVKHHTGGTGPAADGVRVVTTPAPVAKEASKQHLQVQQHQQQYQQQQLQMLQRQQMQQQQHQQHQLQSQQRQQQQHPTTSGVVGTKMINPRRRLKAAERELRDKEITREILDLIKEDSNIQYWKVSARLAEKGYPISPSSVCQKLKSMGIHRRWKPGDKPPMLDMEQLKVASGMAAAVAASLIGGGSGSSADEDAAAAGYEQQFEMGGAHFLSAFTR